MVPDPARQADLVPGIEAGEMGWVIPSWECRADNDWLTVEELSRELGMTQATIRNFPRYYGLQPRRAGTRWGDVIRRRSTRGDEISDRRAEEALLNRNP